MSKHTPAPWAVQKAEDCMGRKLDEMVRWVITADGHGLWISTGPTWDPEHAEESEANARLIAAAPDLLDALTKVTSFVVTDVAESCNGNKCREPWCAGCFGEEVAEQTVREAREALDAARAAIAKVTGK